MAVHSLTHILKVIQEATHERQMEHTVIEPGAFAPRLFLQTVER